MRLPWIKLVGLLLAVWAIAGGAIYFARGAKPTPEKVMRYLENNPLEGAATSDRGEVIEKVATQLNQLAYEERREVRMSRKLDGFFKTLTPEEQARFLDLTLPTGFKQMMEALNNMTPEKRKRFVKKALEDMQKRDGEEPQEGQPEMDANGQKIIDQGFRSFYGEASAETKMDVAPLIEQLQKNIQGAR
jgi:hypothetical protein